MAQTPQIDVLLPCYNAGPRLEEAIGSIVDQTWRDWRLLLLDDGSNDGSWAVMQQWMQRDVRIVAHRFAHRGLVATLNDGLALAQAPFIARMDADDWSYSQRFEAQLQAFNRHPDWDVCATSIAHGGGPSPGLEHYISWTNSLQTPTALRLAQFIESPIIHPSVMFRRACIQTAGAYRAGPFPEDYELWLRWLRAGLVFGKTDSVLLRWNDHDSRLTRTDSRYAREAFYQIKSEYLHEWLKQQVQKPIWVWGAGRKTRQRVGYLQNLGTQIQAWIDIDPHKIGQSYSGIPVVAPDSIPAPDAVFVLGYVGNRGARTEIDAFLRLRAFEVGRDFLFAA